MAALTLHEELASHGSNAPKPTAICHGIEALACKLEYLVDPQDPQWTTFPADFEHQVTRLSTAPYAGYVQKASLMAPSSWLKW